MSGDQQTLAQIGVLIAFALVFLLVNLKAGGWFLKNLTYIGLWAALIGAGYLAVDWIFL